MATRKDGAPRARRKDWESVAEKMERLSIPEPSTGCHIWLGKLGTHGYANIDYRDGEKRLHRKAATVAYELAKGPVPEGLEVSHICPLGGQPWCVNPDHLIAETHAENLARRKWTPRGQRYVVNCPRCGEPKEWVKNAHSITGGEWSCRSCRSERAKQWREKTGYDQTAYRTANKERINAQRRARRQGVRYDGAK